MRFLLIFLILFLLSPIRASDIIQLGSTDSDEGRSIVMDIVGNSYVVGKTKGSTFCGFETQNGEKGFVVKNDPNGALLWTKLITYGEGKHVSIIATLKNNCHAYYFYVLWQFSRIKYWVTKIKNIK